MVFQAVETGWGRKRGMCSLGEMKGCVVPFGLGDANDVADYPKLFCSKITRYALPCSVLPDN